MTAAAGFDIARCDRCGTLYFPRRLICRTCGNDSWGEHTLHEAVVEETTTVRYALGDDHAGPRHLATVRTEGGLRLIAGSDTPLADGTTVELFEQHGTPFVRARRL